MRQLLATRKGAVAIAGVFLVSTMLVMYAAPNAEADHEPANKVAAAGSTTEVAAPGQTIPVLQERLRVSSPFDLILSLSAECDILTDLTIGGAGRTTDSAFAFGQVRMFITIDGRRVPITTRDSSPPDPDRKSVV